MRTTKLFLESLVHTPVEILVASLMLALLLGLAAPGILQMRERAQRNQVNHQMERMGLALSNYHETFRSFPVSPPTRQQPAKPKAIPTPKARPKELISPLVILPMGMR